MKRVQRTRKKPLYIVAPQPKETIQRLDIKEVELKNSIGEQTIGPFRDWNELLMWKCSDWMKMFTEQRMDEFMEVEKERCRHCRGLDPFHDTDCPNFQMPEVPDIDPKDLED
jgi:hypothetical protein